MKRRLLALALALGLIFGTVAAIANTSGANDNIVTMPSGLKVSIETFEIEDLITVEDANMMDGVVQEVFGVQPVPSYLIKNNAGYVIYFTTEDTLSNVPLSKIKIGDLVQIYYDAVETTTMPPEGVATAINLISTAEELADQAGDYDVVRGFYRNIDTRTLIYAPQLSDYKGDLDVDFMKQINESIASIVDVYGDDEQFKNVSIDYRITHMDNELLSLVFTGRAYMIGNGVIHMQHSVNLDMRTGSTIHYDDLVRDDDAVRAMLNEKAEEEGLPGLTDEFIQIYFLDDVNDTHDVHDAIVFNYLPLDFMTSKLVVLTVDRDDVGPYTNRLYAPIPVDYEIEELEAMYEEIRATIQQLYDWDRLRWLLISEYPEEEEPPEAPEEVEETTEEPMDQVQ